MQLYALCDEDLLKKRGLLLEDFVKIAIKHDAKVVQYRNKSGDLNYIKSRLIELRRLYDGFLIINDYYELSEFCDGVHLGQDDLTTIDSDIKKSIDSLRSYIGSDKLVGVSTHNEKEILQANELDINYIGLGSYKATSTKLDISHILGDKLDSLAALSRHPVVAIGGIKPDDRFENVKYIAMGSALLSEY